MVSDTDRMINIAHGKVFTKSAISPFMVKRKGKNVRLIDSVADRTDLKNSRGAAIVAWRRSMPSPIFSI